MIFVELRHKAVGSVVSAQRLKPEILAKRRHVFPARLLIAVMDPDADFSGRSRCRTLYRRIDGPDR